MRKIFTFFSAVMLAISLQAAVLDTVQVDGIYYQINKDDSIATLVRYNASSKYEIDDIVIPVDVVKDEVSYPVVALGQGALRNTTAKTITFAKGSKVTTLGMQAFQAAVNVEEIELPEGIQLIPMTCFNNATVSNPTKTKKVVLPSTIDSIALMSFSLPQLEILEFKGSVPPRIATKETATWTQNPWQISADHANNTAKSAIVYVPAGAAEVYKKTAWIGDYFTTILAVKDTIQVDGLYYELDNKEHTATLIRLNASSKYEIDTIVIPVSVSQEDREYPVVALGQGALRNTTAKAIVFAEGSQVKELGMQAFQAAVNVEELELPEGIQLIPLTCIHNATATNPMTMKKLVLPSTVDSLALFSICLPQLETLEFKGVVPPIIATKETATWTQNPWQISADHACNTAKSAIVYVPAGAAEAYRNTAWIGDYFTTILAVKDTIQVDGLYYELDNKEQTATLIRLNASSKYEIDTIVIPVSVSQEDREYPVVALGQGALRNTTAKAIIFAEGSLVTELGMQAFQGAVNVEELELPEGIHLIPMTCIHNASTPMQLKRLVLPSTVDSLALFSICLPQLETLEFKGVVPPIIATKETATWTQNPWMISLTSECNTNKEAVVIVPKGALEAYKNTAWIGDYFTTIEEEKDPIVEVDNIAAFNAAEDGLTIKLTLTDAKVTAYADLQNVYYVEDSTAATVISGATLVVGTALNGYVIGIKSTNEVDYVNDPAEAVEPMMTVIDTTGITASETTLTPTTMTIPEACAQANYAKLIKIEEVTVEASGRNVILTDSENNTIKARDLFGVLSAEFEWPAEAESVTGICLFYMNGWYIIPISEEAIVGKAEGIEDIESGNGKVVKFIENGVLYIRYNGNVYNVLGM